MVHTVRTILRLRMYVRALHAQSRPLSNSTIRRFFFDDSGGITVFFLEPSLLQFVAQWQDKFIRATFRLRLQQRSNSIPPEIFGA